MSENSNNTGVPIGIEIDEYLKSIIQCNTDILTYEEELALMKKIKEEHSQEAYDEFVEHNLRLVISCAKKYQSVNQRKRLTLQDLIQEGMIGLMKAIKGFDYTRGYKFSTYSVTWINQTMQNAIDNYGRTISVRATDLEVIKQYRINKSMIEKQNLEPTFERVTKDMPYTKERIKECLKLGIEPLSFSLKKSFNGHTSNSSLIDEIDNTYTSTLNNQQEISRDLVKEEISLILNEVCNKNESKTLIYLFGIDNNPKLTIDELADEMKINREQVKVNEHHALQKLKSSHKFDEFHDSISIAS